MARVRARARLRSGSVQGQGQSRRQGSTLRFVTVKTTPTGSSSVPCPAALSSLIIPCGSATSTGVLAVSHAKGMSPSAPGSLTVSVRLRLAERSMRGGGGAEDPPSPTAADSPTAWLILASTARAPSEFIASPTELAAAAPALVLLLTSPSVPPTSASRPCIPSTRLLSAEVAATAVLSSTVSAAARSTPTSLAPVVTSATTMSFSASAAAPSSPSKAEREAANDATLSSTAVTNAGGSDAAGVAPSCGL